MTVRDGPESAGVPQNYAEAAKWYRLAAEQGNARGQYDLGLMYVKGQGVRQDYVQAHMWLNLAASAALEHDRDITVNARDDLAAKMTPAQIAEAQKLAREWKPN
jgi:TPR repeat protein